MLQMSLHTAVSRGRNRSLAWILAGALVLLAQTVSAVHELDPQNQAPDHTCEICLAAASTDDANVGQSLLIVAPPPAIEAFAQVVAIAHIAPKHLPPSRGPPTSA